MQNLSELKPGKSAFIYDVLTNGDMRRRFFDIGLIKNSKVTCVAKSPMGDPKAYLIRGAVIAIRKEDAKDILIEVCEDE